jgi:ABC-type sugar transport system substrate-binding protein
MQAVSPADRQPTANRAGDFVRRSTEETMKSPMKLAASCAALAIGLCIGSALAKDVVIGVSFDKIEPFREAEKKAIDNAIAAAKLTEKFANADKDAQRQASQIDSFVSEGVSAIIAIPWDIEAAVNLAQASIAAGVPFISMDQAPADIKAATYHVGGDPCADGKVAGEFFVKAAGGKPFKLLELQGGLANDNGIRRSKCLDDAVKAAANITIVAQVPTDWNPEKALTGTENALQAHPDLAGIYAPWNDALQGVFSVLKKKGQLVPVGDPKHIVIVSIDGTPLGCKAVRDKLIDLEIATPLPEMAARAVKAAATAANGGQVTPQAEFLPGIPYGPDNIDQMASKIWGCQ